ncbi:MAG: response regulator transcription factor [Oscillospiraceae bacterium]|nr:response regulator transcription factor [Oscillospiraceae bacterium]
MLNGKPLILMVEDNEKMAQLNTRLLNRQGYEVRIAYSAAEARDLFGRIKPDLFVLDIGLPDGDGRELCEEFRRESDMPILFLTGKIETKEKVNGLKIGGDYYLTKPYDREEFIVVVRNLLSRVEQLRKKIEESYIIKKGALSLRLDERKAYVNGRDALLTGKEFAVLLVLVQNEDRELSYEAIYEQVWGMPMNENVNALRQQILRLRKKLGEENEKSFYIFNEHGKGYTFTTLYKQI